MIEGSLVRRIAYGYRLDPMGIHGLPHWARVMETGLRLAVRTGADAKVVALFAVLHDARRETDGWDPHHGRRGAELAADLRGELELNDEHFRLLSEACSWHADGVTTGELTIRTCWDADRLDLWRVGIRPRQSLLCTEAALDRELQHWAKERSESNHVPRLVREQWLPVMRRKH